MSGCKESMSMKKPKAINFVKGLSVKKLKAPKIGSTKKVKLPKVI